MALEIVLDIFSGRENPRWSLTTDQEQEALDRINKIQTPTLMKPSGVTGKLGYRGFVLRRASDSPSGGTRLLIHEGIVDFGQSQENRVADSRAVESWLLSTAPAGLPDEVRSQVTNELNRPPLDTLALFNARAAAIGCPAAHATDAPRFNPGLWNIPTVQPFNNCYNYANDQITNTFAQPGRAHGSPITSLSCPNVQSSAAADGLTPSIDFSTPLSAGQGWYVALVVWPGVDYHWYRQDIGGCWSHKPGQTAARNTDNGGNSISDPRTCDRGPYTDFCTYMVTRRGVLIQ